MNTLERWFLKIRSIRDRVPPQDAVLLQAVFEDWHCNLDAQEGQAARVNFEVLFIHCVEALAANDIWLETPLFEDFFVYFLQTEFGVTTRSSRELFKSMHSVWRRSESVVSNILDDKDFLTYLCVMALRYGKPDILERKLGLGEGVVRKLYDLVSFRSTVEYIGEIDKTLAEVFAELSHTITERPWEIDCLLVRYLLKQPRDRTLRKLFEKIYFEGTSDLLRVLVRLSTESEFDEKTALKAIIEHFRTFDARSVLSLLEDQHFIFGICSLQNKTTRWTVSDDVLESTAISFYWFHCHESMQSNTFEASKIASLNAFYQEAILDLAPHAFVRTILMSQRNSLSPRAFEKGLDRLIHEPQDVALVLQLGESTLRESKQHGHLRAAAVRSLTQLARKDERACKQVLTLLEEVLHNDVSGKVKDTVIEGLLRLT